MDDPVYLDDEKVWNLLPLLAERPQARVTARRLAEAYRDLAERAYMLYSLACGRKGWKQVSRESFIDEHLQAWADYFLNAADAVNDGGAELLCRPENNIFLLWHFPEYPRLLKAAVDLGACILIARDGSWMESVAPREQLINFRRERPHKLIRALRAGRPVFAMLDYCYAGTQSIYSSFLGFPARTPSGLVKLADRFGYRLNVLDWRSGVPAMSEIPSGPELDTSRKIDMSNHLIEEGIACRPGRWLLWASVDQRWDYWR